MPVADSWLIAQLDKGIPAWKSQMLGDETSRWL
jgi:hypothetical protein